MTGFICHSAVACFVNKRRDHSSSKSGKYPLVKNFSTSDYEYLARKLPPERVQAHVKQDNEFVNDFIKRIKREGITVKASPRVVSNLMKSLFFVGLHRNDLGSGAYVETMEVLADLVAGYIVEGA